MELPVMHNQYFKRSHIDKRNRKSQNEFKCQNCGYEDMADYVAAVNIAARAAVNQPIAPQNKE
jgi:transposase